MTKAYCKDKRLPSLRDNLFKTSSWPILIKSKNSSLSYPSGQMLRSYGQFVLLQKTLCILKMNCCSSLCRSGTGAWNSFSGAEESWLNLLSPNPRSWSPSLILALSDRPDLFIFFNRVDNCDFLAQIFCFQITVVIKILV